MTRDEILSAPSMPAFSPSYPHGPYRFIRREYLIITYRTDPEKLRAALKAKGYFELVRRLGPGRAQVPAGLQWDFYGEMFVQGWTVPKFDPARARELLKQALAGSVRRRWSDEDFTGVPAGVADVHQALFEMERMLVNLAPAD